MPASSDCFWLLSREFDSLVTKLNKSPSVEDRRRLLRRMKVLIVEIDMLISSSLKQEIHDTIAFDQNEQHEMKVPH